MNIIAYHRFHSVGTSLARPSLCLVSHCVMSCYTSARNLSLLLFCVTVLCYIPHHTVHRNLTRLRPLCVTLYYAPRYTV